MKIVFFPILIKFSYRKVNRKTGFQHQLNVNSHNEITLVFMSLVLCHACIYFDTVGIPVKVPGIHFIRRYAVEICLKLD